MYGTLSSIHKKGFILSSICSLVSVAIVSVKALLSKLHLDLNQSSVMSWIYQSVRSNFPVAKDTQNSPKISTLVMARSHLNHSENG